MMNMKKMMSTIQRMATIIMITKILTVISTKATEVTIHGKNQEVVTEITTIDVDSITCISRLLFCMYICQMG